AGPLPAGRERAPAPRPPGGGGAYAQAFEAALAIRPVNRSIAQGVSLVAKLHADVGDHERAYALSEYLLAEPLAQAPIRALNGQVVEERRSRLPPARARAVAAEAPTWDLGRVVTDEVALLADLRRRLERSPRGAAGRSASLKRCCNGASPGWSHTRGRCGHGEGDQAYRRGSVRPGAPLRGRGRGRRAGRPRGGHAPRARRPRRRRAR